MTEEVIRLKLINDVIADVEWSENGTYLAITKLGYVITPEKSFAVSRAFQFPKIRILNDRLFLIADTRAGRAVDNCFIFDSNGIQVSQFIAGDGIEDILVVNNKIVITYFDEGVFARDGPNTAGLVIFDLDGKVRFKWNGDNEPMIDDCYCVCQKGSDSVLFFPYTEFPLVELNLSSFEKTIATVPTVLRGSTSISAASDSVFFHGPYDDKRGIYKWYPVTNLIERIGEYSEGLRGLTNGKFLSKGEQGFTIIDVQAK